MIPVVWAAWESPFPQVGYRSQSETLGPTTGGGPINYQGTWMSYSPHPYQNQARTPGMQYSTPPKSFLATILLSFFLGNLGIDRMYLGHVGLGIAKLLLNWATFGIWWLIDLIIIACKGTEALRRINWV